MVSYCERLDTLFGMAHRELMIELKLMTEMMIVA